MLIHVVRPGEMMWSIAQQYGVPVESVIWANRWVAPENLRPGMRLWIPQPSPLPAAPYERYRVQPGDTLWAIAWRAGVSMDTIIMANRLTPPYTLQVGQVLRIP